MGFTYFSVWILNACNWIFLARSLSSSALSDCRVVSAEYSLVDNSVFSFANNTILSKTNLLKYTYLWMHLGASPDH